MIVGPKIQQPVVIRGATCPEVFLPLFFVAKIFKGGEDDGDLVPFNSISKWFPGPNIPLPSFHVTIYCNTCSKKRL